MKQSALMLLVLFWVLILFVVNAVYSNAGMERVNMKLLAREQAPWSRGNLEKVIMTLIEKATPVALSTMCATVSESENGQPIDLEPRIILNKDKVIVELYANCSFKSVP